MEMYPSDREKKKALLHAPQVVGESFLTHMISCVLLPLGSHCITTLKLKQHTSKISLGVGCTPWIFLSKGSPLHKREWEDAHGVVTQPTAFPLQGATQMQSRRERAGGGILWSEGVLLPWHLSPLSSQDTKIWHSEGSFRLLTSVWSKQR